MLDLENNNVGEQEDMEDVELEGIDLVTQANKNRHSVFSQEYKLEVLCRHHNSKVTGDWRRHCTSELVLWNFT